MKDQRKVEEAVAEAAAAEEYKVSVWGDEDELSEDAAPYDTLRPVLTEMLKPKRCYTTDIPIKCPFCLEGLAVIAVKLGPKAYRLVARSLERPEFPQGQQGYLMSCKTSSVQER